MYCVFHIRRVMPYLAQSPIGKEAAGASEEAAQMLTQLPARTAFVSSSLGARVMFTYDTAPQLRGHERTERFRMLRDQTRARYCHQREEVENADQPTNDTDNGGDNDEPQWRRTEEA